jgi:hypothetical protein
MALTTTTQDDADVPGADVEDADSTPDTTTTVDNNDQRRRYGTFENPTNDLDDIADVDAARMVRTTPTSRSSMPRCCTTWRW